LPPAKIPTLREQAHRFHEYLAEVKSQTPLNPPRVIWYPWETLSQLGVLDTFLQNDFDALKQIVGHDPVLDVGCGDGDIAFFLETLGMQVDAVDYAPTNNNALLGVHALKRKLGSSVRIHEVDLDTRPTLPTSNYGFTVMLGVLYHLKNPFLVLEALARASRYIFLSTRIASLGPDRQTDFGALPLAYLVEEDELNNDETNFWIFSEKALQRVMRRAGWDVIRYATFGPVATADPVTDEGDARAFLLAKSRLAGPPRGFRLREGWHQLEDKAWRWTERIFSMELDTPASLQPATLRFAFQLPEIVFAQTPVLNLAVRINGTPIASGIYSMPGEHEYIGTVPATDNEVSIAEFELDRAIAPTDQDRREPGLIVDFSAEAPIKLSYTK
jgi:2-polyprenyl-3-methyl-5-hydroxy-6-metoxy-1,4-benzoquinol methylase